MRLTEPRAFIADIGPKPCGPGFARTRRQQLYRRIIGKQGLSLEDMPRDGVRQRLKQGCRFTNPIRQGGAVQIDPLALEYLALPVQRRMIAILRNQNMGEQTGAGTPALNRPRGQCCLGNLFTAGAGHARAHDPVHDKTAGNIFELFGHILAKPLEPAATVGAGITRREHRLIALQVIGQRSPLWLAFFVRRRRCILSDRRFSRQRDLFLFQRQLKLIEGLRPRPEPMAALADQLMLQLLDQKVAELELGRQRRHKTLQDSGVVR